MAAPELVIADAAYKVYPGGVIALRASDWMAAARGTLTTAADTLACTGSRVRDTQQVSNNMFTNATTALDAFAEAEDTLEIPVSSLPLNSNLRYELLVSLRVVGDWDITNYDTMNSATQAKFAEPRGPVAVGFYGAGTNRTLESEAVFLSRYFRKLPHYVTTNIVAASGVVMRNPLAGETMWFRAYSQAGTTLEVLLDQILIFPYMKGFLTFPDNRVIGGQVNVPSSSTLPPVDGADGGDANGEFTWAPQPGPQTSNPTVEAMALWQPESGFFDVPGGGDYQRVAAYADAERYTRLAAADGQTLENLTGGESSAVAYSLAGVRYHPLETIVSDDFARTTIEGSGSSAWGDAPGGFMWVTGGSTGRTAVVEGGVGKWKLPSPAFSATSFLYSGGTARVTPASVYVWDAYNFSGEFRVQAAAGWPSGSGTNRADVNVRAIPLNTTQGELNIAFVFSNDALDLTFRLRFISATTSHVLFTGSIASWYSHGDWIAWRVEKRRYLIRVKVWDASGAEPAAWDYTQFIPVEGVASGSKIDYPYANNPRDAIKSNGAVGLGMSVDSSTFGAGTYEIWWDNINVDYDPGGDPEQMSIAMERPEGTEIAEIDVPYGAAYFVYWGLRDWTDLSVADYNIAYSTRVWNDLTAAELQRAEEVLTWFGILGVTIVPMNWRSSERPGSVRRVLVGDH